MKLCLPETKMSKKIDEVNINTNDRKQSLSVITNIFHLLNHISELPSISVDVYYNIIEDDYLYDFTTLKKRLNETLKWKNQVSLYGTRNRICHCLVEKYKKNDYCIVHSIFDCKSGKIITLPKNRVFKLSTNKNKDVVLNIQK